VSIVARIQGHKPSATAEQHYRLRPLGPMRLWLQRIEAQILGEASVATPMVSGAAPVLHGVGA
jgi:hypothetical protein